MFDRVGRTGMKITVCNSQFLISICKFWSTFCPETDSPFVALYVKWVFSGYKSLSLNIQDNSWRGLNVLDGHYLRKFLKDSGINLFLYNVWSMTLRHNLTYIVYHKHFRVDRKRIDIGCVRPTQKWLILWILLTSKGKAYFYLQWIIR